MSKLYDKIKCYFRLHDWDKRHGKGGATWGAKCQRRGCTARVETFAEHEAKKVLS